MLGNVRGLEWSEAFAVKPSCVEELTLECAQEAVSIFLNQNTNEKVTVDKPYSRGVLILKETKFISLSIWAERLHDGNDASRGERCSAVKGWT